MRIVHFVSQNDLVRHSYKFVRDTSNGVMYYIVDVSSQSRAFPQTVFKSVKACYLDNAC